MEDLLFKPQPEPKKVTAALIVGLVIGVVLIGVAIYLLSFKPSMDDQSAKILEGAMREGSPGFAEMSRNIVISNDLDTVESPTGMGTISMYIKGNIRNRSTARITALEVNVSVVDTHSQVIKEKRVLVVPLEQPELGPGEVIPATLSIDGFSTADDRAMVYWKVTAIKTA